MFTFTQIVVSRPQFILERLDIRRLLSASIAADVMDGAEATEVTEVVADPTMIEQTVIDGDVLMFNGEQIDVDPRTYQTEILTMEEPVENLEDVPPPECYEVFDGEIRYTMMPGDNERNLDEPVEILTLEEEPLENLEDTGPDGTGGEILTFGGDGDLDDPNVIFYSMGGPGPAEQTSGGTDLPPPPSQSSPFAPAAATKSLSDDVLDLSDGNVLAS